MCESRFWSSLSKLIHIHLPSFPLGKQIYQKFWPSTFDLFLFFLPNWQVRGREQTADAKFPKVSCFIASTGRWSVESQFFPNVQMYLPSNISIVLLLFPLVLLLVSWFLLKLCREEGCYLLMPFKDLKKQRANCGLDWINEKGTEIYYNNNDSLYDDHKIFLFF